MSLKGRCLDDLPDLTIYDIEFWLHSVEQMLLSTGTYCEFHVYDCVKSYLSEHHEWALEGLREDPDDYDKLQRLRDCVVANMEKWEDAMEVLQLFVCRDLKPSAFLYVIKKNVGSAVPKSMKRVVLLARLPRKIQKVVFAAILMDPQSLEDRTLENLAALADGVAAYDKYHSFPSKKKLLKLPQYIESDPELWFYSLDEAFAEHGITEEHRKFEHTISVLQLQAEEILTAALFLTDLPNQPTENKYTNLRERIIKTFAAIQNDDIYMFVFRNMKHLKPRALLQFLNNSAAKSGRIISRLLIRTFWMMLLPVQKQAILFKLWAASREPLQDLDINAMALVAEKEVDSNEEMFAAKGVYSARHLDSKQVDEQVFQTELQSATSFQLKIALGMKYCDFMYRTYYRNNPHESVERCTVLRREEYILATVDTEAKRYFFEGCCCWYHDRYGEFSINCNRILPK